MLHNLTTKTIALQMLVLIAAGSMGEMLKDAQEQYKEKADNCNKQAIDLYMGGNATPNSDIKKICPGVAKPCCSKADMEGYVSKLAGVKASLKQTYQYMNGFYDYVQTISADKPEIKESIDNVDEFRKDLRGALFNKGEMSLYLESVMMSISGLGCSICDAKHGADFKFKDGRLESLEVQPEQCLQGLRPEFKLYGAIKHLESLSKYAKSMSDKKKIPFNYDTENLEQHLSTTEENISKCITEFKVDNDNSPPKVDAECLELCRNTLTLAEYKQPFEFQKLASEILKIFKETLETKEKQTDSKEPETHTVIFNTAEQISGCKLEINKLGINTLSNLMEPEYTMLDPEANDINKPIIPSPSQEVAENDENSSIMLVVGVGSVLLLVASLGAFIYFKPK